MTVVAVRFNVEPAQIGPLFPAAGAEGIAVSLNGVGAVSPVQAAGQEEIRIAEIAPDGVTEGGWWLWLFGGNIPAGAARMPFGRFSLMTLLGAATWCTVLAWFGARVLGDEPRLLQDPEALSRVLRHKLLWFVAAAGVLFVSYLAVDVIGRRMKREAPPS